MPVIAKIQNAAGPDKAWRPDVFHRVDPSQVGKNKLWWFQGDQGIFVLSENAVRRTKGKPSTLAKLYDRYRLDVAAARRLVFEHSEVLHTYADDVSITRRDEIDILMLAIMATESGGRASAARYEKHLNDWSFGPFQILTNTAYGLNRKVDAFESMKPVPKGGDPDKWARLLSDVQVSAMLALELIKQSNKRWNLKGDPIQLYACYNAGGPYASKQTPWGLRAYDRDGPGPLPGAFDHFAAWYGDACNVWWGS